MGLNLYEPQSPYMEYSLRWLTITVVKVVGRLNKIINVKELLQCLPYGELSVYDSYSKKNGSYCHHYARSME